MTSCAAGDRLSHRERKGRSDGGSNMNAYKAKAVAGWTLSLAIVGLVAVMGVTLYDQVLRYL